jgi:hypothetical protein
MYTTDIKLRSGQFKIAKDINYLRTNVAQEKNVDNIS